MSQQLLRKQVVEHIKQRLYGDVLLIPKPSHTIVLSLLLLWLTATLIWLFNSNYARKEVVFGWLEPPQGVIRIYAESTGNVQNVLVSEGEQVEQGQPLIIITNNRILPISGQPNETPLHEYEKQQQLLAAQITQTASIYDTRIMDVKSRITSAKKDLTLIREQINTLNENYSLINEQAERYITLKQKSHVSTIELNSILQKKLALKNEQNNLLRNKISQENTIDQLIADQKILATEKINTISELHSREIDLNQKMMDYSGKNFYTIRAARSGIVNNIQAIEGQQAKSDSNIPLLTLFPISTQLNAHLLIPVRSIGFVEKGQHLAIRYDAFPYQKFGIYEGSILQVSKTLLLPDELLNSPINTHEPVYRVIAELNQSTVDSYGKKFMLKPGMTLSADISLGNRSIIEWLLEPIYSLQGRK